MKKTTVELLDCTLRDGAYIVDANFGTPAIKGIIKHLQDSKVEVIECGWLKNSEHKEGTTFFHLPTDLNNYILEKNKNSQYVVMIDWDRYDLNYLPEYDGKSIDAIRVVFPQSKFKEGVEVGKKIKEKGYEVYFQAANTLAYSEDELKSLAELVNDVKPVALSVVDTFGAMFDDDVERIVTQLDEFLDDDIKLGFHSHNNQQLSFSLSIKFIEKCLSLGRSIIVDSSLCGMGRGAGNTTTELLTSYLNTKHHCDYDLNQILDAIDMYMGTFQAKYSWGYSTPYFIAGMYCCHVNNIAYLLNNHRTNAQDMRNIIESLSPDQRLKYDYDILEKKFLENQSRQINDEIDFNKLKEMIGGKKVLLIAPGKSSITEQKKVMDYIAKENPIVIGVNAFVENYDFDFVLFVNAARYNYAKEVHESDFAKTKRILLSSVKACSDENEFIINFNSVIKRGWNHFDNAMMCALRLMSRLQIENVSIAGFDGFKNVYNESYADVSLPSLNPENKWDELNDEILSMYSDFTKSTSEKMILKFITNSIFDVK